MAGIVVSAWIIALGVATAAVVLFTWIIILCVAPTIIARALMRAHLRSKCHQT